MKIVLERVWERHCSLHPKNPCPWSFGVQDHRKTGSSSSIQKSLQKRFVSLKTTSSSFVEKTLQRKKFFRIEIAMRFIEKRPLRVICKNRCRSASSHRKRPLRGGKNVAEEGVLQDRNRDTFHRKKRPLRVQCSNRCRSDTFHRKRPLRVQWKNVAEEGVVQDRNRDTFHQKTASSTKVGIPTLLWNFTSRFVFGFFSSQKHNNVSTMIQ